MDSIFHNRSYLVCSRSWHWFTRPECSCWNWCILVWCWCFIVFCGIVHLENRLVQLTRVRHECCRRSCLERRLTACACVVLAWVVSLRSQHLFIRFILRRFCCWNQLSWISLRWWSPTGFSGQFTWKMQNQTRSLRYFTITKKAIVYVEWEKMWFWIPSWCRRDGRSPRTKDR